MAKFYFLAVLVVVAACFLINPEPLQTWPGIIDVLEPHHKVLGQPEDGEWLSQREESGQTFDEYILSDPVKAGGPRKFIYIQPIGDFDDIEKEIVVLTAEYMNLVFGLEVKTNEAMSANDLPEHAKRHHPEWGIFQLHSRYILNKVLKPKLPADAATLIAFTKDDLYPEKSWNFVFGQASLVDRVGVWSIARNGNPQTEFILCLRRTLKTAIHETGHMFSIQHCIQFECAMCGSNHRQESDKYPLWFCPHDMAKLCWAHDLDPIKRYEKLAHFCRRVGLKTEADFFTKSLEILKAAR
jgi:archaemetzincin